MHLTRRSIFFLFLENYHNDQNGTDNRNIPHQDIYRLEKLGLVQKDLSQLYSFTEEAFDQY